MFRRVVMLSLVVFFCWQSDRGIAEELSIGKNRSFEFGDERVASGKYLKWSTNTEGKRFYGPAFGTSVPITLKAGQLIELSASAIGNQKMLVALNDTSGTTMAVSKFDKKTAKLRSPIIGKTGTYDVVVLSDAPGRFTLKAEDPDAKETAAETGSDDSEKSIEALEEKIKQLKKELVDAENELKIAKAKQK